VTLDPEARFIDHVATGIDFSTGLLVAPSLRLFGRRGHTLVGNLLYGLAYLLMGVARTAGQFTSCLVRAHPAV
jgi:hypothetical protein